MSLLNVIFKIASFYRGIIETETEMKANLVTFYRDTMDQMHCYLFHMFDIGMRINDSHMKDTVTANDFIKDIGFNVLSKNIRSFIKDKVEATFYLKHG